MNPTTLQAGEYGTDKHAHADAPMGLTRRVKKSIVAQIREDLEREDVLTRYHASPEEPAERMIVTQEADAKHRAHREDTGEMKPTAISAKRTKASKKEKRSPRDPPQSCVQQPHVDESESSTTVSLTNNDENETAAFLSSPETHNPAMELSAGSPEITEHKPTAKHASPSHKKSTKKRASRPPKTHVQDALEPPTGPVETRSRNGTGSLPSSDVMKTTFDKHEHQIMPSSKLRKKKVKHSQGRVEPVSLQTTIDAHSASSPIGDVITSKLPRAKIHSATRVEFGVQGNISHVSNTTSAEHDVTSTKPRVGIQDASITRVCDAYSWKEGNSSLTKTLLNHIAGCKGCSSYGPSRFS